MSFFLSDIEDLPPAVQEKLFDEVLDRDVQKGENMNSPTISALTHLPIFERCPVLAALLVFRADAILLDGLSLRQPGRLYLALISLIEFWESSDSNGTI